MDSNTRCALCQASVDLRTRQRKPVVFVLIILLLMAAIGRIQAQSTLQALSIHRTPPPHTSHQLTARERKALSVDTVGLPFIDNMENGTNGWVSSGFMHLVTNPERIMVLTPDINPRLVLLPDSGRLPFAHSGKSAWWYGEDSTGTFIGNDFDRTQFPLSGGQSTRSNSGSLVSPPIDLRNVELASLSFSTWWEIEGVDSDQFDVMSVEVSIDSGITFQPLGRGRLNPLNDPNGESWKAYSSGGLGNLATWTNQLFDLTPYKGNVVLLNFTFDTRDNKFNGFRGWFIDDIAVTATALPAPVISSVSPRTTVGFRLLTIAGQNFVNGATINLGQSAEVVDAAILNSNQAIFTVPFLSIGTYDLTITNPDGKTFTLQGAVTITDVAPPIIASITPDSTGAGLSIPVTIQGSGFKTGCTADIAGSPVQKIVFIDSLTLQGNSPSNLPGGLHNVRVTNPDGQFDELISAFKITGFFSAIEIQTAGDSLAGNNLPMTITPPTFFPASSGWLHFRKAGTQKFDSLALTLNNGKFTVQLPSTIMDIRGVEYYISLSGLTGGVITHPPINPLLQPAILRVKVSAAKFPLVMQGGSYRMVSVPIAMSDSGIAGFFGNEYGAYNKAAWRLFRWENGANVEFPAIAASFTPGNSFWLITKDGNPFIARNGLSVVSSQPYNVTLQPGWNQIADPFAFPVDWRTVSYPGRLVNIRGLYLFDGTEYLIDSTTLNPWEGYFVRNDSSAAITLSFFPQEADTLRTFVPKASPKVQGFPECSLRLAATIPGTNMKATQTRVGIRWNALDGKDVFDYPQPPPITEALHWAIRENGDTYLQNMKSMEGEGKQWMLQLSAPVTNRSAVITVELSGTLPTGFEFFILDKDNENIVGIAGGSFSVQLSNPSTVRTFMVIIGTKRFAEAAGNGIPLQPYVYSLEQNFPNPFNPETTIRYQLAARSNVSLEIYDILGQKVRTLLQGSQATGEFTVSWNGANDAGQHLATGVYLCRLRANEFTAVRKLLLVR